MKSSTIRRSNLSKEKLAVLEALSKFNNSNESNKIEDYSINSEPVEDGSPEVYVRQNKEKELDLLWKDFKLPKGERSPIVYLGMGFAAGIIATLTVSAFIGMSSGNFHLSSKDSNVDAAPAPISAQAAISEADTVTSEDTASAEETKTKKFGLFQKSNSETETSSAAVQQQNKEYEVQSGDTMEKIVRSFYGSYSSEKVDAIMKSNNMTDPNRLSIGQKLIIPAEGIVETNSAE